MGVKRSHPSGASSSVIVKSSIAYLPSSSNIGDLNAPAWKAPFTGAWGTVGTGTEKEVVLGYPSASGTAGFVSLQCTGDTDSFQLTEVEGESLDTPQTFAALTNSSDLMYIAFRGALVLGDRAIDIKIIPIFNGGAAKTMTIDVISHEGSSVGTLTASATVLGLTTVTPTGIGDFTGIAQRANGTVMTAWGTNGGKTGIHKTLYQGGWGDQGSGVGSFCRIDKEITSGSVGYVQYTPTSTGDSNGQVMGLGYLTDYDFVIPSNTTANYAPKAARWGAFNWSGFDIAAGSWYNSAATAVGFYPSPWVHQTAANFNQAGRTIRLEWNNNVVSLRFSDDVVPFSNSGTTVHTYAMQIDVAQYGNLVVSFANYNNAPAEPNSVFEAIQLNGVLV
jgi:hypothetical protein